MELQDLHDQVSTRLNETRMLLRLIETDDFKKAFLKADERDRYKVTRQIDSLDIKGVRLWLRSQHYEQRDYSQMTVRELRKVAGVRKIPDYQWMDKFDLIINLEEDDERIAAARRKLAERNA